MRDLKVHPGYVLLSEEGDSFGDLQLTGQLRVLGLSHPLYAPGCEGARMGRERQLNVHVYIYVCVCVCVS